ncbi:MAG: hypothetical protein IT318_24675 [Anaerolineales bacterium]|nr:hypothetical protein [Anaerolineales bacterium]
MTAVPIEATIILNHGLSSSMFRTYARLKARAWDGTATRELRLPFDDLKALVGLSDSKTREHLKWLKELHRLVAWTTNGDQVYTLRFLPPPAVGDSRPLDSQLPETGADGLPKTGTGELPFLGIPESRKRECGGGGLNTDSQDPLDSNHQHQPPENGSSGAGAIFARVERLLLAVRLWPDAAIRLAGQIAQIEAAAPGDLHYLDAHVTTRDVLGYVLYVRDPEQEIRNRPGLISKNLAAGRWANEHYRPHYICGGCHKIAPHCTCADGPQPTLPEVYDVLALAPQPAAGEGLARNVFSRWGICETCYALPCQCPAPAGDEREPEPARGPVSAAAPESPTARFWRHVLDQLSLELPKSTFDAWLRPTQLLHVSEPGEAGRLTYTLGAANQYARDWLDNRLAGTLTRLLGAASAGRPVQVVIEISPTPNPQDTHP